MHLMQLVEEIFKTADFSVEWNVARGGFTIELLAKKDIEGAYDDIVVACACTPSKDLQKTLAKISKARKKLDVGLVVLVVSEGEVLGEDRQIARRHEVLIWQEKNIQYYLKDLREDAVRGTRKLMDALGHGSFINIKKDAGDFNAPKQN